MPALRENNSWKSDSLYGLSQKNKQEALNKGSETAYRTWSDPFSIFDTLNAFCAGRVSQARIIRSAADSAAPAKHRWHGRAARATNSKSGVF